MPVSAACEPQGCSQSKCQRSQHCCTKGECCEIAQLIYEAMTACYATERRNAIHRLGDRYDCVCHPEVMNAFIYALNDSDERVRSKAADEIGDQVRRNRCICGNPVIQALRQSLADCDRRVRREAEQALTLCGYDIVDMGVQCPYPDRCWTSGGCQTKNDKTAVDNTAIVEATQTDACLPASTKTDTAVEPASGETPQSDERTFPKVEDIPPPPPSANPRPVPPAVPKTDADGAAKSNTETAPQEKQQSDPAPSAPKEPQACFPSRLKKRNDGSTTGTLVRGFRGDS